MGWTPGPSCGHPVGNVKFSRRPQSVLDIVGRCHVFIGRTNLTVSTLPCSEVRTLQKSLSPSARPGRTHEKVTRNLLGKLFRGTIAPGEKLPTERVMAETFAVNRATVREALRYLEHLDLIAIRQGDGAYARHFLESRNLETAKAMVRVDARDGFAFPAIRVFSIWTNLCDPYLRTSQA